MNNFQRREVKAGPLKCQRTVNANVLYVGL